MLELLEKRSILTRNCALLRIEQTRAANNPHFNCGEHWTLVKITQKYTEALATVERFDAYLAKYYPDVLKSINSEVK